MNHQSDNEEENTWMTALFNKLKKKADPIGYATNNKARRYYNDALLYDPSAKEHRPLNLDDQAKTVITKIISRMIVANDILREITESKNPDHSSLETLLEAKRAMPGFFSECDDAILLGLHNWRRNIHKRIVKDLSYYVETKDDPQAKSLILTPQNAKSELAVTPGTLKTLATKSYSWWPSGIYAATINYISKHYFFPVDHITTVESTQMCNGMLYFNPQNPDHTKDAEFTLNPDLEWQRLLVKKVLEREKIYLTNLAYYLLKDKRSVVMKLSRPKEENPNSTVPSCLFTQVSDALCGGYLCHVKNDKIGNTPVDPKQITEKLKQEELRKKAAEEAAAKKKAEAEQEELKRQQALKEKETAEAQKLEEEIQRRVTQQLEEKRQAEEKRKRLADEKTDAILREIQDKKRREEEEKKAKEEAEAVFKDAEEKQRAAKLNALAKSQDDSSLNKGTAPTPSSNAAVPATNNVSSPTVSTIPKLEQNPEDTCACGSTKKYKNCCKKKTTPSGSPQRP
jgi:hypothetical protein